MTEDFNPIDAQQVDGMGGVLMPGFIGSHSPPVTATGLEKLSSHGVITAMVMSCFSPALCVSLQNQTGLTDV